MLPLIKTYLTLTKPGVLFGNVLTTVAGFLLASGDHLSFSLFLLTIVGTTLVIASACVLNNYFDRDIDAVMSRTKKRAVASGKIPGRNAVIFGILLGFIGFYLLFFFVNFLVGIIGLIGFIDYVLLYGILSKRMSWHGTLVGSISGAMPILAGYVAAAGTMDMGAVLVFLIIFFWQFPEFYSISIYRRDEYKAAGVPVISVVKGIEQTKLQIFLYTIAFVLSTLALSYFGYTGSLSFWVMAVAGLYWIWLGLQGLRTKDDNQWARKMFRFSLIILLLFCFLISVQGLLQLP